MGRRDGRAADRAAAAAAGWAVVTGRDVLPAAWTRAWAETPHRWGDGVHRVLAAICGPAYLIGPVTQPGWFHRDRCTVVVRLRPFRRPRWWALVVVYLLLQVVLQGSAATVGRDRVLAGGSTLVAYALVVASLASVRARELTTRAERQGFWRVPGDLSADWVLSGPAVRGDPAVALPPLADLVDARVPAGSTVLAWSPSERRDRELATAGFTTAGRQRGHLVRLSTGTPGTAMTA